MSGSHERELAAVRSMLRSRDDELAASRQELEDTNRGLIALHAELEDARAAAARLAAIVECSQDSMFSLTPEGIIQTWNPGAERLLGYTAAEIVGQPVRVLVPAELADELDATLKRVLASERSEECDTRRRRKDGSLVDVAVTWSAMLSRDGQVTGICEVHRDITARLEAEAELAAARAGQDVLAERDRMARDLRDRVIQRVFAAGLSLQTAASLCDSPQVSSRIQAAIGELDASIDEIRKAIFTLRHGRGERPGLRAQVLALVTEAARALGFTPVVSLDGPVDSVPLEVADQLLAVLRESLSNVARHARASAATVALSADGELLLSVTDNGRGMGPVTRRSGLDNMQERARVLGGTCNVASEQGAWTQVEWRVPLHG